jgi:biopolymer transport protein ExbD
VNKKHILLLLLEEEDNNKEEIQIIPTIDVMMFLLVFFIVYTLNVIPMFQQSINIPSTKTAEGQRKTEVFKIFIDKNGNISTENGLSEENQIRNYIIENKDKIQSVLIVPDKEAKVDKVIGIFDILKQNGITELGIASKRN